MGNAITVHAELSELHKVMDFITQQLDTHKCKSEDKTKALLISEETFVKLVTAAKTSSSPIKVTVSKNLLGIKIKIKGKGEKLENPALEKELELGLENVEMDESMETMIRNQILKANTKSISQSYKYNTNTVFITVGKVTQKTMLYMLGALLAGLALGIALRFLTPETFYMRVNQYALSPIKTVFLNALGMIVGPVIFFSIASSIGSFTNPSELGKIGARIAAFYTFTTIVSILLGLGITAIIQPGQFGEFAALASGKTVETTEEFSILNTLIGIVPSNIIKAFADSNSLQIIFLAILFGMATTLMGQHSQQFSDFLQCANELFMKIAGIITYGLPLMICASIASLVLSLELNTVKTIMSMLGCIFILYVVMMTVYNLLVLIMTKRNPLVFMKNAIPAWFNALALSSSNASMAYTMEVCDKKLGISPRIYSFSIPLGATINMDGLSMTLTVVTLFFAKVFGIPLSMVDIVSLVFTVTILSMGAPGVPGVAIFCFSILSKQFGIPAEALAIFIGITSILDPINTANNVFGDITGTYVVAARNGLLKKPGEE